MAEGILQTRDLNIGYSRKGQPDFTVLSGLNLDIKPGEVVCILGQNGSGKSTLIRSLAGLQPVLKGDIRISGENVDFKHPKKLARLLSVVLTDRIDVRNLSVFELVAMGRYPYTRWFGRTDSLNMEIVEQSLAQVNMLDFAKRPIQELSDGELQRAMIAKALTQDTSIILLDEPTAHLDLPNRIQTMQLLRKLSRETGKSVLLSTHDYELALQTADLLWLIQKDQPVIKGIPEDMVLDGSFERAFLSENVRFEAESGSYRIAHPIRQELKIKGNSIRGFWTRRAFEREGILVHPESASQHCIHIFTDSPFWGFGTADQIVQKFDSIESLIVYLKKYSFNFEEILRSYGFE